MFKRFIEIYIKSSEQFKDTYNLRKKDRNHFRQTISSINKVIYKITKKKTKQRYPKKSHATTCNCIVTQVILTSKVEINTQKKSTDDKLRHFINNM